MEEGTLIGSYNQPDTAGIYISGRELKVDNPSWLLLNRPYLYAVTESDNSLISCFEFGGEYKLLGQLSTQGRSACHISIDRSKRFLFVTNYSSGDFAVFLLEKDGRLLKLINFFRHEGPSGVVPDRQEAPHPHCTTVSYDNKALFVSDLGTDWVYWYAFDAENSNLQVQMTKSVRLMGDGPRHLSLGAEADGLLFLACELQPKIVILSTKDRLSALTTVMVSSGQTYLSEIKYFTKGAQLMVGVASRGDNEVVLYELDNTKSPPQLKLATRKKTYNWPRHFNVNATRNKLIVACQKESAVV